MIRDRTGLYTSLRLKSVYRPTGIVLERHETLEKLSKSMSFSKDMLMEFLSEASLQFDESCWICSSDFGRTFTGKLDRKFCQICLRAVCRSCYVAELILVINQGQNSPFPKVTACVRCAKFTRKLTNRSARWHLCAISSKNLYDAYIEVSERLTSLNQKLSNFEGLLRMAREIRPIDHRLTQMLKEMERSAKKDVDVLASSASRIKAITCPLPPHNDSTVRDNIYKYLHEKVHEVSIVLRVSSNDV